MIIKKTVIKNNDLITKIKNIKILKMLKILNEPRCKKTKL